MMWSGNAIDLRKVDVVLEDESAEVEYEFTPYIFTTLENGKKAVVEPAAVSPPSWLLLDHTIAVVWSLFSLNPPMDQLNIDDLKWAYEFLKDIKNKKGENPPDVKVCLKEIQDQLINLYARLTALQDEDFDEIAAVFGEKIIADTNFTSSDTYAECDKDDSVTYSSSIIPSGTANKMPLTDLFDQSACKDLAVIKENGTSKHNRVAKDSSSLFAETKATDDEEVEKYIMSLFHEDKKEEQPSGPSSRSFIPTKKKHSTAVSISEMISSTEDSEAVKTKKEKTSKKVHCVAEMRSLKFQKSMKVQDTNGEEAAYSNLKAEIRRLTFNPNVSRNEIMNFLKEWRSEQVNRLHNELKRLNSIEELMKAIGKDEFEPNLQMNSHLKLKELDTTKSKFSLCKRLLS